MVLLAIVRVQLAEKAADADGVVGAQGTIAIAHFQNPQSLIGQNGPGGLEDQVQNDPLG